MAAAGFLTGRLVKGMQPPEQQPALPAGPTGTAAGDPLAGIAEPSIGATAGYTASPYPETSYQPVDPAPSSTSPSYAASGSAGATGGYVDPSAPANPLTADTHSQGAL